MALVSSTCARLLLGMYATTPSQMALIFFVSIRWLTYGCHHHFHPTCIYLQEWMPKFFFPHVGIGIQMTLHTNSEQNLWTGLLCENTRTLRYFGAVTMSLHLYWCSCFVHLTGRTKSKMIQLLSAKPPPAVTKIRSVRQAMDQSKETEDFGKPSFTSKELKTCLSQ